MRLCKEIEDAVEKEGKGIEMRRCNENEDAVDREKKKKTEKVIMVSGKRIKVEGRNGRKERFIKEAGKKRIE